MLATSARRIDSKGSAFTFLYDDLGRRTEAWVTTRSAYAGGTVVDGTTRAVEYECPGRYKKSPERG